MRQTKGKLAGHSSFNLFSVSTWRHIRIFFFLLFFSFFFQFCAVLVVYLFSFNKTSLLSFYGERQLPTSDFGYTINLFNFGLCPTVSMNADA